MTSQGRPNASPHLGPHTLVLEDAGVVLHNQVGNNDVADRQHRIEPAGHAGEHDCAATESVGKHGRNESGIDLAHP
jgi:hypothetical protein